MFRNSFLAAAVALVPALAAGDTMQNVILKTPLNGMEGAEAMVIMIDAEPGWETPKHIHPGHIVVYVIEGTAELEEVGGATVTLTAGQAGYETPNVPLIGRNPSATERLRLVAFQLGSEGDPVSVPVE